MNQPVLTQVCPRCNRSVTPNVPSCPYCGFSFIQQQVMTRDREMVTMLVFGLGLCLVVGIGLLVWRVQAARRAADALPRSENTDSIEHLRKTIGIDAESLARKEAKPGDLSLEPDWKWTSSEGSSYIVGIVKNGGGHRYSYVEVKFKLKDADDNVVGSAWTNTTDLAPGETWKFKAYVDEKSAVSASFSDLSGD